MDPQDRTYFKKQAEEIIKTNDDTESLTKAVLMIGETYFYRSKNSTQVHHPKFDTYVKHWIHSNINNIKSMLKRGNKNDSQISKVIESLISKFPKPEKLRINKNYSYWEK